MPQPIPNDEKMNLSEIISTENKVTCSTSTRQKSDSALPMKESRNAAQRKIYFKKQMDKVKTTPRKRSLTMTDIRNKMPENARTPRKCLKEDSCSTTDYSPRSADGHPVEKMLSIRERELQIRIFTQMYCNLWRKHKYLANKYQEEAKHLDLQKSFLINLRDKESERREEITKVAEKQKTEIIDLEEMILAQKENWDNLNNFSLMSLQEYKGCLKSFQKTTDDLAIVHCANQQILEKIEENNFVLEERLIDLDKILNWAVDFESKTEQRIMDYNVIKKERDDTIINSRRILKLTDILKERYENKLENEKNLNDTIRVLRSALDNACTKNINLKSAVKNMTLQLEFTEQQLEEQKNRSKTWTNLIHRATRFSMFILHQIRILSTF